MKQIMAELMPEVPSYTQKGIKVTLLLQSHGEATDIGDI